MTDLNLALTIKAQADVSGLSALLTELNKLGVDVSTLQPEVETLSKELDTLGTQQKLIENFRNLQSEIGKTQTNLDGAKDRLRDLTTELNATDTPSKALVNSFQAAGAEVSKLQTTLARQETQLSATAAKFASAGLEVKTLSTLQGQLVETSSGLSERLETVKTKLEGMARTANDQKAVSDALKAIGLDAGEIATGITKAESQFLSAFQTIRTNAQTTEEQLRAALITVFQGVQTPAALRELDSQLQHLVTTGKLSAEQVAALRDQATKPIADPTPEFRSGMSQSKQAVEDLKATIGGLVTLGALERFVSTTVDASRQAEAAFKGLESVAQGTGIGIGKAYDEATKLAANGILSMAEASQALQNLLSRGYGIEQAVQSIQRLSDAAAFNRQSHLQWGEAIVGATEGLKNENSELVDNAGVTKNVSVIWKEYADSVGKSVEELTKSEKIQAEVTGILKETEMQAGNTEKALNGLEGQVAKLNKELEDTKVKIGQALTPAMAAGASGAATFVEALKPLLAAWQDSGAYLKYSVEQVTNWARWILIGTDTSKAHAAQLAALNAVLEEITKKYYDTEASVKLTASAQAALGQSAQDAQAKANAAARAQAEAAAEVQAALKTLGVNLTDVNTGMEKLERDSLSALTTIVKNSTSSGQALEASLLAVLQKIETHNGLIQFRQQLDAIVSSGRVTGTELENLKRLQDAINEVSQRGSTSLAAFKDSLGAVKDKFADAATASDRLGQALKTLNVDLEQVKTGLSSTEANALSAFKTISTQSQSSSGIIAASLIATIGQLDSLTGLKNLRDQLANLAATGQLSSKDMLAVTQVLQALSQTALGGSVNVDQLKEKLAALAQEKAKFATQTDAAAQSVQNFNTTVNNTNTTINQSSNEFGGFQKQIQLIVGNFYDLGKNLGDALTGIKDTRATLPGVTDEMQKLLAASNHVVDTMRENQRIIGGDIGWDKWVDHANTLLKSFYDQRIEVERVTERLQQMGETGKYNQLEILQANDELRHGFDLLDQQHLEGLQNALDEVNQKVKDTTRSLQDMIAQQKRDLGDQASYEEYVHQKRVDEIKAMGQTSIENSKLAQEALSNENRLYDQQIQKVREVNKERAGTKTVVADELKSIANVDMTGLDSTLGRIVDKLRQMLDLGSKIPAVLAQSSASVQSTLKQLEDQAKRI